MLKLTKEHRVDVTSIRREDLYLSEDDVRSLLNREFSVGAHGLDHLRWTRLGDAELEREVTSGADWLARCCPWQPACVAYPDAAMDKRVANAVARVGFELGVVLETAGPREVEPRLRIRRMIARDDELWIETLAELQNEEAP